MEHVNPPAIPPEQPQAATSAADSTNLCQDSAPNGENGVAWEDGPLRISSEAWDVLSHACHGLTDEQIDLLLSMYRQHGDAFAAFISLDSVDPTDSALVESFLREYCGKHPVSEPIERYFAEEEHWESQVNQAIAKTPIPRRFIRIDYEELAIHLTESYESAELGQWRYLFH